MCFIGEKSKNRRYDNGKEQDTVAYLRSEELYGDHGVELVFECGGSVFLAQQAVQIVARGGLVGVSYRERWAQ